MGWGAEHSERSELCEGDCSEDGAPIGNRLGSWKIQSHLFRPETHQTSGAIGEAAETYYLMYSHVPADISN